MTAAAVSFVVPVHNGAPWIRETLQSILAQADGRPMDVIVVDDRSQDGSSEVLRRLAAIWPIRVVEGPGRGAAAAINVGLRAARTAIVFQVDQDVVLGPHWMSRLALELDDPSVAAAQGYYVTDRGATLCARVMGFDLEQRYASIPGRETDHVCTGNAAYRLDALRRVGLFDESLGYGYDNDMSYRLRDAGCRLVFCRDAKSVHRWREGLANYCIQQYGFGYGRIDLVAKHRGRATGDSVSPLVMMAHPLAAAAAVATLTMAAVLAIVGGPWRPVTLAGGLLLAAAAAERLASGVRAARRFGSWTPLAFSVLHATRDFVWIAAIGVWCARRVLGQPSSPAHSMPGRSAAAIKRRGSDRRVPPPPVSAATTPVRAMCLIPAHNEEANLPAVIADVRSSCPAMDILVIDDGSTDRTALTAERLGVRWLRFPERMGIGSAMRAGLRYAALAGYAAAVRIDGDGQHRAADIHRVLEPIAAGRADVVLGSRYVKARTPHGDPVRLLKRSLGGCLSALTGKRVTDPTSGFCALGPRAIRLLAEHHPTGYGEPELRLFMSRNALNVIEAPVGERSRLSGRTSLTPGRLTAAGARALLAMLIVPLRSAVGGGADD